MSAWGPNPGLKFKDQFSGIKSLNVGQNLLLLSKVGWHIFFIIIKS